jgi:hypothetical protein
MALTPANIQLGPGSVFSATYSAGNYSIDSGDYTDHGFTTEKGASFSYKGKELEVQCGNNLQTQKIFIIGEDAELDFASEEVSAINLARAFGYKDSDITTGKFTIGDNSTNNYFTVLFETTLGTGLKAILLLYKCQWARECEISLAADKVIEIPNKIRVLPDDDTGDTAGILGQLMIGYTPA